ncbi:hypothetical protein TNCT_236431 [Trichonephila clavata]|uniref:Uncharacterized protein n=1 Tax=Trichonephila clavata TaxID=2740835 RepID=A0A8X6FFL0_TRICU|nr:hypothetical protein TNCT_236431 [Trichonephila clavata]
MALQAESQPLQHPKIQKYHLLRRISCFCEFLYQKVPEHRSSERNRFIVRILMMLGVEKISFEVSLPKNKNNSKMEETRNSHFLLNATIINKPAV